MWLIIALFSNIPLLLIGWILMSIGYFLVLKKAGLKRSFAVAAGGVLTDVYQRKMTSKIVNVQ